MTHDCHFNDFILIGPTTHDFISADVSVTSAKADGATSAKAEGATSAEADGATSAMRHEQRHQRQSLAKKGERERD